MNNAAPLPFEKAFWIIPGKLMGGCYPGASDLQKAEQKLRGLLDHGVSHVVNLMEENEVDHGGRPFVPYQEMLQSLAEAQGRQVTCVRYPIPDLGVPSREQMRAILDDMDAAIAAGKTVYLHCWGGVGRTGTVAACYLARHGMAEGPAVLDRLAELRLAAHLDKPAPETEAQRKMAVSWKKGE